MTHEEQRIAIAIAIGWKKMIGENTWWFRPNGIIHDSSELPDYLNDLNAMAEAEKTLPFPSQERDLYFLTLAEVVTGYRLSEFYSAVICAPAAKRAEAFLRTKGLWKE